MTEERAAEPPDTDDLDRLREAARDCTGCELHWAADQTVFGLGPASAWLMLVGEQPGDREDRAGEPFVGPAGGVLDRALAEADIDRSGVYVTNAVKHFRFELRGKRRIHQSPTVAHVRACRPWLDAELRAVAPAVLGTLGATAAQALLGRTFRLTQHRGEILTWEDYDLLATVHPSSVLRAPDGAARAAAFDGLVADLRVLAGRAP